MTLPLRRKHPTTAPNSRKGREGTSFSWDKPGLSFLGSTLRWAARALTVGGLAAAVSLTGVCAEPDYFAGNEPAESAQVEPAATSQATVLRWKTSRISRSSAEAAHSGVTTTVITASHEEPDQRVAQKSSGLRPAFKAPAKAGSWNKGKVGSASNLFSDDGAIRLVAHDPKADPFGDRAIQAGREPALAAPAGTRKAALNDQVPKIAAPEAAEPDAAEPIPKAPANLKPVEDLPAPMEKPEPKEETEKPGDAPATDAYNFRDCQKAEEGCALFLESLRGVPSRRFR